MKKKTKTYWKYKEIYDYINFLNTNPSQKQFTKYMIGRIIHPYHLYYLCKYPNGNIPQIKIRYRESKND